MMNGPNQTNGPHRIRQTRGPVRLLRVLIPVFVLIPAFAFAGKAWKKTFNRDFNNFNSDLRRKAVESVDPNSKSGLKVLLQVVAMKKLAVMDWHIRWGAIEALSGIHKEKYMREFEKKGLNSKYPAIREGCILALGLKKNPAYLPRIKKGLEDPDPAVRRAAGHALANIRKKESINALVARWEKESMETNFRECIAYWTSLRKLTGRRFKKDFHTWQEWWLNVRDKYKFPEEMTEEEKKKQAEEEAKKGKGKGKKGAAEEEGEKETTVVRGIPLTFKTRGTGIPLLVIHDDTWYDNYFEPYLSSIEKVCKIFYIRLPEVDSFENLKRNIGGMPYYPVDKLVDAFEELRTKFKYRKFAIMAHGFSTLIAQRYLTRHSEKVSHMILMGALSGDEAYGIILNNIEREGNATKDKEMTRMAWWHTIIDEKKNTKQYEPKSDAEKRALQRKMFSMYFANPQDPEIFSIFDRCKKPLDYPECLSPEFDTYREKKVPVPILILMGAKCLWTNLKDGERIQKNYPRAELVVFQKSAMMPFIEENAKFTEEIKKFFKKYPYPNR
jgi:pimeloyl-ACP methyl ester carboxylesterase